MLLSNRFIDGYGYMGPGVGNGAAEVYSDSGEPFLVATESSKVIARKRSTKILFMDHRGLCCAFIFLLGVAALLFQPASDILSAHRAASIKHDLLLGDTAPTKIFFIVTASIDPESHLTDTKIRREDNVETRIRQYERGLANLKRQISMVNLPLPHEIVVVENNGPRKTFLDDVDGLFVVYTNNNKLDQEKGLKELDDVLAVIRKREIHSADLVVKMTGRYFFDDEATAPFMTSLEGLDVHKTRALVKFGSYSHPVDRRVVDCITGLIMVPAAVIQRIASVVPIEHSWARAVLSLPESEVHAVQGEMGFNIAPAGRPYFLV